MEEEDLNGYSFKMEPEDFGDTNFETLQLESEDVEHPSDGLLELSL